MIDLDDRLSTAVRAWASLPASTVPVGLWWDAVVTADGLPATAVLRSMDTAQPGGCGPAIHDPANHRMVWLTQLCAYSWSSRYGLAVGAPVHLKLPPKPMCEPSSQSPYWVRPPRHDHPVAADLLESQLGVAWLGRGRPNLFSLLGRHDLLFSF